MTQTGIMREARRVSGLTQTQAAAAAGVSVPTYVRYETEFGEFRVGCLKAVADAMNEEGRALVTQALSSFFDEGVGV